MSQLSAQSILELCDPSNSCCLHAWHEYEGRPIPMIRPFSEERLIIRGRSAGLSAASYDVRIAHDLTLGVNPAFTIARAFLEAPRGSSASVVLAQVQDALREAQDRPCFALAHTLEDFAMPAQCCRLCMRQIDLCQTACKRLQHPIRSGVPRKCDARTREPFRS